ncbi:MAG: TonB-dependent receptor domain-containing protein [Vicinamibacteraceae bacterium]
MRLGKGSHVHAWRDGVVVGVAIVLVSTVTLRAQFDTGQIAGFVRDGEGLVIPGATVSATNEGTGQESVAVSNDEGYYVFPSLLVGTYTITAELSGFKRAVRTGVRVSAASRISVDTVLEVGEMAETVEVQASPAALQAETPVLGRTVGEQEIARMPLSGRNPVFLSRLQAGVIGGRLGSFGGTSIGTGIDSISGGRANDVLITVDGAIGNRTRLTSDTMLGAQDVNTVQEIQVLTTNYSAEYGRASSGIVRMVTKSGTRELHGTVTHLLQNDALNANTWERNRSGDLRLSESAPPWQYNQFGFAVGGPIPIPRLNPDRSKLFFFWGEEWIRRREEVTRTLTVPSLAMRKGDFRELLDPSNPFFGETRTVTDPETGRPFPNNVIPVDRISAQGQALLGIYPEPTPGFLQGTSNWIGTFPAWQDQRKDTVRIDYQMSDRHRLAFRGTHIPYRFNTVRGSTRYDELWSRPNRTAALSLTSTLSPTLLNELTVSASSDGLGEIATDPACGARCRRSTYGVSYPYLFPADAKLDPEKLPTLEVTGLSDVDNGPYPGRWSGYTYALSNNMTKVMGGHTLKWGVFIERSGQNDQIQFTEADAPATNNENGAFRFFDTGHPDATELAIANVLLGRFNDYSEFGAKPMTPFAATMFDGFLQDSWKATPALTVEAGVRYSLLPPWYSKWNTLAEFHPDFSDPARAVVVDPSEGFIVSGDRYNGIVMPGSAPLESASSRFPFLADFSHLYHDLPRGFAETHTDGFQPRVGFAYAVNERTTIRGGVGKFFNRTAINSDLAQGGQPPFMEQFTVINGSVDAPGGAERRVFPFTITTQDPVLKPPTAWTWNITLQRELPSQISLEVSYVGRRGYHNQRKRNINQLQPGTIQTNPDVNADALRPFRGMGVIGLSENSGKSRYNALQVSVNRRLSGGLQFGVGYTYSRNMDNGSGERDMLPDAYDDTGYWGISDLDRPHVLVAHYMYELPSPGGPRLARWILAGWSIAGINQFQSGEPFSVRDGEDHAGVGPGSGDQFWHQIDDPMQVERTSFTDSAVWFNGDAFVAPEPGTFGVQSRNALRDPGFWDWNLSVRRSFRLARTHRIDFRWEAFNVLNHPTLGSANNDPTSGSFGLVTSKTGNRTMQVVLQYGF